MADDHNDRSPRDRQRINMSEDDEVLYWSKKWGVSREQLSEAVRKVGPMSAAVGRLLGKSFALTDWPPG
jgi:uncharacterized protein DUF3606